MSLHAARRMAVHAALLDARLPPSADGIMRVVEGLGRLQLDPTRAVERSHLLVLWSRLGAFDRDILDRLLWKDRRLFEYDAYIYPTSDYPSALASMRLFATRDAALERRARAWLKENGRFASAIMRRLRRDGPLPSRAFSAPEGTTHWKSSGWTAGRDVTQMFHFLERAGRVMVAGRQGNVRLWDLPERVIPASAPRTLPSRSGQLMRAIERLVRRRGVCEPSAIPQWIAVAPRAETRAAIGAMVDSGRLVAVTVSGAGFADGALVHADDIEVLRRLSDDSPAEPRTTLLSPFDPLINDRERTQRLFGFRYRLEMYRPASQRRDGYFVMPILRGEQLVGRAEPAVDRSTGALEVRSVSLERASDAPPPGLDAALSSLREFVAAGR